LEERKKLDQLRKEKDEERQLQDLQRLQEEQTGRKRTEKLDWMYATPASGSGQSANDLEDYLLGKKRVDKLLIGDDNQAVSSHPPSGHNKILIFTPSLERAIRTLSPFRMPTLFVILLPRLERIPFLLSSSRSSRLTRHFWLIH
jgi:hypothetical protein